MAGAFQAYAAQVRRLREKDAPLAPVTALSSQITQTMVDEITDWPFFPTALSESR